MPKSFVGAHGQPEGVAPHPRRDCTLAAVSSRTHPKNVPVRPSWPELHRSRPPPAAAAEARCGTCTRNGSPPGSAWAASSDHFPHRGPGVLLSTC